jgi:hypothetical protein
VTPVENDRGIDSIDQRESDEPKLLAASSARVKSEGIARAVNRESRSPFDE